MPQPKRRTSSSRSTSSRKSTARKSPARKSTARKSTARKSTARSSSSRRSSGSDVSKAIESGLKGLNDALDSAQEHAKSVRGGLTSRQRTLTKDVEKALKNARRDSTKMSKAVRKELEQLQKRIAEAAPGGGTKRRSSGGAKKSGGAKRSTAKRSTASRSTAKRSSA